MADQEFNDLDLIAWGDLLEDAIEFTPMEGYGTQPMDMSEFALQGDSSVQPMDMPEFPSGLITNAEYASFLVDQFLTPEQFSALPASPGVGGFNGLASGGCFGAVRFTSPMAANLEQISAGPSGQQSNFDNSIIDPNLFGMALDPAYTYGYGPMAASETFVDQALLYQHQDAQYPQQFDDLGLFDDLFDVSAEAPLAPFVDQAYPFEEYQNVQLDDLELFGQDELVAPPAKHLFLPEPVVERTRRVRKADAAPVAIKSEAGPSTPAQVTRKPLADISPLRCAGEIKVVNEVKQPDGNVVKLPYKYTVYKPLRPWGAIKYNARGYLHEAIKFDARKMNEFINSAFTLLPFV